MALRQILIVITLLITISSTIAEDVTIVCNFEPNKEVYESLSIKFISCNLQNNLSSTAIVKEAIGTPGTISPSNVQVFEVTEKMIQRIPKGMSKAFLVLIGMKIHSTDFNYLSKDDLEEYKALKYLQITQSKLSVILGDTFDNNNALELVDLSSNPISFIGSMAFDLNKALTFLSLDDLLCDFGENSIATTPGNISDLISSIEQLCNATNIETTLMNVMKNYLEAIGKAENCGDSNPEEECPDECEVELAEWKDKFNNQTADLETCEDDKSALNDESNKLKQEIEELEALTSSSGDGSCSYKIVSKIYSCYAKITVKTAAEQTVNWNGTHATSKKNDDVLAMVIFSQTVEILPLNIGTTFKGLKSLTVKNSGLTKIKVGDFKTLTKLETLVITGNNVGTIDATAFTGLTQLKKLDLSANKITVLPSKVFDSLLRLEILNLSDNSLKIRYDVINADNKITEIYLANNKAILPLDRSFIWRLQKAQIIDLSETSCEFSLDKTKSTTTFMTFYNNIVKNC